MEADLHPWLRPALEGATWLHLSPGGGERWGTLLVTAVPLLLVGDLDAATAVLWKRAFCLEEDWPYEPWTDDAPPTYPRAAWDAVTVEVFPNGVQEDADVAWLAGRGAEVVQAQRTVERPVNPWRACTMPWAGEPLETLSCVTPGNLRRVLSRRWNDTCAVFERDGVVTMVSWSTSA